MGGSGNHEFDFLGSSSRLFTIIYQPSFTVIYLLYYSQATSKSSVEEKELKKKGEGANHRLRGHTVSPWNKVPFVPFTTFKCKNHSQLGRERSFTKISHGQ